MYLQASILMLVGSAAAVPFAAPQHIEFDKVDAAPKVADTKPPLFVPSDPIDYSPEAAAAAAAAQASKQPVALTRKVKRDADCSAQPAGAGPSVSPDTAAQFKSDSNLASIAENAPVPQGYSQVFSNLNGATEGNGYLGYYTLSAYDPIKCQQYCDAATSCYGINVYMERDPTVIPADSCPNPPSTTNYKCSLWGYAITDATATNQGQIRNDFQVVIAGSNGYVKNAPPPSYQNFSGPTELGGAINAPSGYIGYQYFSGPYDPSQCAAGCQETTAYDEEHLTRSDGSYDACNFFVAYVLSEDNSPLGTYCAMYTQAWGKQYSTNVGEERDGHYYSVSQAYSYTLTPQDPGNVNS